MNPSGERARVLLATDVPFWREGRGDAARIAALAIYLSGRFELRIVFLDIQAAGAGPTPAEIAECSRRYRIQIAKVPAADKRLAHAGFAQLAAAFRPHACLIEYLRLSPLRHCLSPDVLTILDTHDIISDRNISFRAHGETPAQQISRDTEFEIFAAFDKVLLIQSGDYRKVAAHVGDDSALLAPHPVDVRPSPVKDPARSIGFIASSYAPNRDGYNWFVREVWPLLQGLDLTLDVYGPICRTIHHAAVPGVRLHGQVPSIDIAYQAMDIAINPVRYGAGLKIKNIEALGHGLPLVTTPHSAMGLPESEPPAFLVADSAQAFSSAINSLAASTTQLRCLSERAVWLASTHFSPDACFGALADCIQKAADSMRVSGQTPK